MLHTALSHFNNFGKFCGRVGPCAITIEQEKHYFYITKIFITFFSGRILLCVMEAGVWVGAWQQLLRHLPQRHLAAISYHFSLIPVVKISKFVLILNYLNSKVLISSVSDEIYELASSILDGSSKPRTLAKLISKVVDRPVKDVYLALDKNLKKSKN